MKHIIRKGIDKLIHLHLKKQLTLEFRMKQKAIDESIAYLESHMQRAQLCQDRKALLSLMSLEKGAHIAELGVYKGESTRLMAALFPEAKIDGFDSFEGLPEAWDFWRPKGLFNVDGKLPDVPPQVTLHKGWFDTTLPAFSASLAPKTQLHLLHIDCDIYSSTKTTFDALGAHVQPGTYVLFGEIMSTTHSKSFLRKLGMGIPMRAIHSKERFL